MKEIKPSATTHRPADEPRGNTVLSASDLLSLFSAETMPAFLTVSMRALSRRIPCAYISAFYRRASDGFLEERDSKGRVWSGGFMRRYAELTPAVQIVQRNPGIKVLSTRAGLGFTEDELVHTPLYREIMRPQGWRHGAALCFWTETSSSFPFFVLTIYRTAGQPDFCDADFDLLERVHPYLAPAINRLHQSARLHAAEAGLALALRHIRGGLVMLDWQLQVVRSNAFGRQACERWSDAVAERTTAPSNATIELPADVLRACQALRRSTITALRKRPRTRPPRLRAIVTSGNGLNASATVVCGDAEMDEPGFIIEFKRTRMPSRRSGRNVLTMLTAAEREVAQLIADGCSNQEAGEQLGKTIHAVKFLLHSAYKKLGVSNRVKLSVLVNRRLALPAPQRA